MYSISEDNGLSLISKGDRKIYSVGISTGGAAEIRMAQAHENRHIVATTVDVEGANYVQKMIDQAGLCSQIEVKVEDISKPLAYKSESFDFVYARLVLHYLPKNELQIALQELQRILKPAGRIFIVIRSNTCPEAQTGDYNPSSGVTTYTSKNGQIYRRYFHSQDSISDFVKEAGFQIRHLKNYDELLCVDFERKQPASDCDNLIEVYATILKSISIT